jgi:1-acyl-sn-glycerol-3-phosphate acyltransferase
VAQKDPPKYTPFVVRSFFQGFAWWTSKLFWSIRYHGMENIPHKDAFPYIIASNHQAYFDPAWVGCRIKQKITFMAWGEAFEWKVVGPLIRMLGAFPVDLGGARALASIKHALRVLKDGAVLVIFPEGERAFSDGEMLEFKEGIAAIAIRAQVPILPATIKGGNRVWPQGKKWPRFFTHVDVTYHPLIYPPKVDEGDACDNLTSQLRDIIASSL